MQKHSLTWLCFVTLFTAAGLDTTVPETAEAALMPESGLLLTRTESSTDGPRRRFGSLGSNDPIRSGLIDGTLAQYSPQADDGLDGQAGWTWKRVAFDENGAIEGRGAYLYAPIESDTEQVLILNASGQSETYVSTGRPAAATSTIGATSTCRSS